MTAQDKGTKQEQHRKIPEQKKAAMLFAAQTAEAVLAKLGQGTPLKELLRWWDRASEEERGAFLKEITTQTRRPRLLKESPSQAGDHDALPAKDHLR